MPDIRRLQPDTINSLRSSLVVESLPACIVELVQNALDAHARNIEVVFALSSWYCSVTDDGCGITRQDLRNIGKRYYTSKAQSLADLYAIETYGYRGEALASIADVSLTEIISKTAESIATYTSILQGGQLVHHGPSKQALRDKAGTVVNVRDLFYKWPVRRKQAMLSSTFRQNTIRQIRQSLEAMAIAHPNTAFQVVDSDKEDASGTVDRVLTVPRTASNAAAFAKCFGSIWTKDMDEICLEAKSCSINGFISHTPAHNRLLQLIYINGRHVARNELHDTMSALFANSVFADKTESDERTIGRATIVSRGRSPKAQTVTSPKKYLERHPVFCLFLRLPWDQVEFGLETAKRVVYFQSLTDIVCAVRRVAQEHLKKLGYLKSKKSEIVTSPGPPVFVKRVRRPLRPSVLLDVTDPLQSGDDCDIWTTLSDPVSGRPFQVNRRTGNTRQIDTCNAGEGTCGVTSMEYPSVDRHALRKVDSQSPLDSSILLGHAKSRSWLGQALQDWTNPVFASTKRQVPSLEGREQLRSADPLKATSPLQLTRSIDKLDLQKLRFVCQVDHKFLLCYVERGPRDPAASTYLSTERPTELTDAERTLVLIDQHAADERIRIETLLRAYATQVVAGEVEMYDIETAEPVLLTSAEAEALSARLDDFRRWGVRLNVPPLPEASDAETDAPAFRQIVVHAVPLVISDRLMSDKRLIQQVVRGYLGQTSDCVASTFGPASHASWLNLTRNAPSVIIDLMVSKACRGAIMFNDVLTHERCERLLSELAKTDFPFMCAHGRPSMLPLLRLPNAMPARLSKSIKWHPL